ncbi:MAG: hypothetical protein U5K33_01835 [Halofilum sp. (in: g-proteobacteria)]|nr:hypothetical protein [Halofilum sp. (in: g-proteobacteria)]
MSDDDIPILDDVVRPGSNGGRANDRRTSEHSTGLTDEEIEAIARRVMDRYSAALERSIANAIRRALDRKDDPEQG